MKYDTDYFESNRDSICQQCSPLLNRPRQEAFEVFRKNGFPAYGSEDYQHTDIENLLKINVGIRQRLTQQQAVRYMLSDRGMHPEPFHQDYLINGYAYKDASSRPLPEGIFSGGLNDFAEKYPDVFSAYYNRQAKQHGGGLSAFNTMFVRDGYVLYVPENKRSDAIIQLTHLVEAEEDAMVISRLLIILEKGAEARIAVYDRCPAEKAKSVTVQVSEIYAGENASLEFYHVEESAARSTLITDNFIRQERYSNVKLNTLSLENGITRNNYRVGLDGEYAEHILKGLVIADKEQHVDNHTVINHNVPHCHSDELFKYLLSEKSMGAFSGKINVAEDAQKTMAYQNHRNLLDGPDCRVFSKPQLEIYADDVKCSHGMTTGQMDETVLLYMRARGISEKEARMMLRVAFAGEIIEGIGDESLRENLRRWVENRLRTQND